MEIKKKENLFPRIFPDPPFTVYFRIIHIYIYPGRKPVHPEAIYLSNERVKAEDEAGRKRIMLDKVGREECRSISQ